MISKYAHPRFNRGHTTSAVSRAKALALAALVFLASPAQALAQPRPFNNAPCPGLNCSEAVGDVATLKGIEAVFSNILTIALSLAGIVLFIMFITGGFRYLTAGGDAKAVEAAKGTLTHAIAGLVVLILAWIIIQFIEVLTGVNLSTFRIYRP